MHQQLPGRVPTWSDREKSSPHDPSQGSIDSSSSRGAALQQQPLQQQQQQHQQQ
jgi:hypothetical protein